MAREVGRGAALGRADKGCQTVRHLLQPPRTARVSPLRNVGCGGSGVIRVRHEARGEDTIEDSTAAGRVHTALPPDHIPKVLQNAVFGPIVRREAALATDALFCAAYENVVLCPLAEGNSVPRISTVITQAWFPEQHSQPDMLLLLEDGRRVACEHKIEAGETVLAAPEGEPSLQLERYLCLPDVVAVAYFRATLKAPADNVLAHRRYLCPTTAAHFLWSDLYAALAQGDQPISAWLREGFERLGFTPSLPHVGELSRDDPQGQMARENFSKLWLNTREQLSPVWRSESGRASTVWLTPKVSSPADNIFLDPRVQGGRLLRIRIRVRDDDPGETRAEIERRLEHVLPRLPVPPDLICATLPNGHVVLDLLASLYLVLGDENDAQAQSTRLLAQVAPVAEALTSAD